jgi:serine/threonine-protein kinase
MLRPGTRIGGLRIDDLIGRGAMGEVYRGEQVSLKRPVAVKRIADHLLAQEDAVARFHREAQCLARVHSPHVVAVHDFARMRAEDGSEHWLLVMELVERGRSLRSAVGKPMPWRDATAVALQIAQGLAAAAELGVVHRDVKPDNVIVSARGVAKLADFGLARSIDSTDMTQHGSVIGTPAYMSPEACRGEAVDARGDLYALGATWYQLLTGRTPFQAENTPAMLRRHIDDEPTPIATMAPEVPPGVAALVHRCLAKDRGSRPQSAAALVAAIRALALDLPETVPLVEQTAPIPEPATAATRLVGPVAMAQVETATALPPTAATVIPATASTAPTVLLPMDAAARRRRFRRITFGLAGVALVGVIAAGIAFVLRDPVPAERARVDAAIAAGDLGIALRLADAMAARWPDRREALDAEQAVVAAEIDHAVKAQAFDQARSILAERRRSREWLDGNQLALGIDIAQARAVAAPGDDASWEAAHKRLVALRQQHPHDPGLATAILEILGPYPVDIVVGAALELASQASPPPTAIEVLAKAERSWGPFSDTAKEIRAALIRQRPQAIAEANADIEKGTAEDPTPRIAAYLLLREAGKLNPAVELRYHVRNVVELSDSYTAERDSLTWLQDAVLDRDWDVRKGVARIAPFTDVEGLHHEGEHEKSVEDLLLAGFVPEVKDALRGWMKVPEKDPEDFENLRYNAWHLMHRANLAEGFDDFAFHAETLRTFYPSYDRPAFDAALVFFKAQAGTPHAAEAIDALKAGEQHVEDEAALMDKNLPGVRGPHMRRLLPKLQAAEAALSAR